MFRSTISTSYLLLAATMLLLATACTQDPAEEPQPPTADIPIAFSSETEELTTRAGITGEIDLSRLRENHFGVFAYYTGAKQWDAAKGSTTPNFMYNQRVQYIAYDVQDWSYEPVKYWPNNSEGTYLSFFAYAPYAELTQNSSDATQVATPTTDVAKDEAKRTGIIAVSGNEATGAPEITYRLSSNTAEQVDLMWGGGSAFVNTDLTKQTVNERVQFIFHHALATIDVYVARIYNETTPTGAAPATDATKIFVSDLKLTVAPGGMTTEGTLDLSTGKWTQKAKNSADFVADLDASRIQNALMGTTLSNSEAASVREIELNKFSTSSGVTETLTRLTAETFATMLVPFSGDGGIQVTPTLSYNFVTQDDALEHSSLIDRDGHKYRRIQHTAEGSPLIIGTLKNGKTPGSTAPADYTLESGKRYILVCYIGVESVEFLVVSVEDWDFPIRFQTWVNEWKGVDYPNTADESTWENKQVDETD